MTCEFSTTSVSVKTLILTACFFVLPTFLELDLPSVCFPERSPRLVSLTASSREFLTAPDCMPCVGRRYLLRIVCTADGALTIGWQVSQCPQFRQSWTSLGFCWGSEAWRRQTQGLPEASFPEQVGVSMLDMEWDRVPRDVVKVSSFHRFLILDDSL